MTSFESFMHIMRNSNAWIQVIHANGSRIVCPLSQYMQLAPHQTANSKIFMVPV